jgi:hypothetical protein
VTALNGVEMRSFGGFIIPKKKRGAADQRDDQTGRSAPIG